MRWVCVNNAVSQREMKTNLQYKIVNKRDHSCVPKLAGPEVKVKLENCRKKLENTCLCLYI